MSKVVRGFSLLELMVVVAVIGIMALYMTETKASAFSRHATEATVLATDKLETLRTEKVPATSSDTGLDSLGKTGTGGIFSRAWTVTTGTTYIDLQVTVSWSEDGVNKSVVVYGRRGL